MRVAKTLLNTFVGISLVFYTLAIGILATPLAAEAATTGIPDTITYQGRLKNSSGAALTGTYDFIFYLYDASTGGTLTATVTKDDVTVTSGYFTTSLSFDDTISDFAENQWLLISVRPDGTGAYESMSTRVAISSVAYAQFSRAVENSAGAPSDDAFDGRMYYDSTAGRLMVYSEELTAWNLVASAEAETISSAGFVQGTDDTFIPGMLGVEGNVYTDGTLSVVSTSAFTGAASFDGGANPANAGDETLGTTALEWGGLYIGDDAPGIGMGADQDVYIRYSAANDALQIDGGLVAIGDDVGGATATGDDDLFVKDALEVDGATDLDGTLSVASDATFDGNILPANAGTELLGNNVKEWDGLYVGDDGVGITFGIGGDMVMNYDSGADALELIGPLVSIGADPGGATATGDGDLLVTDALEVDGATDLDGTLNVASTTIFGGDTTYSDTMTFNVGGNGSDVAYNVIGDSTAAATAVMVGDDDLFIEGNLEVIGSITGSSVTTGTTSSSFTIESDDPAGDTDVTLDFGDDEATHTIVFDDGLGDFLVTDDWAAATAGTGTLGTTANEWDGLYVGDDGVGVTWGAGQEFVADHDSANSILGFQTAQNSSLDINTAIYTFAADNGALGMVADSEIFEIGYGAADDSSGFWIEVFAVDEDGDTTIAGDLVVNETISTAAGDLILNPADDLFLGNNRVIVLGANDGNVAYHSIGDSIAGASAAVGSDNDLYIEDTLEVDGEIELDGTLDADGAADFAGGLTNSAGELLVSGGNMQFNDDLLLTFGTGDDASIEYDENGTDQLRITGSTIFASAVEFDGAIDFDSTVDLAGGVTNSAGELLVSGGNMQINDDLLLTFGDGDDLSMTYDETTDDAFEMTGALVSIGDDPGGATATATGDLIVSDALEVDGATDLDGTLAVAGIATFTLNVNADGGLDVDDAFVVADGGVLTTSQTANFDGSLDVDGAADFSANLVNSAGELLVSGGNMQFNDDLVLTFGTGDDASIEYDEDGTDQLRITGSTIFASAVEFDGALNLDGATFDLDATGSIDLTTSENAADSIALTSTAGGIDILATGAAAGEDIDITATGSSVNITSTEGVSGAIRLDADNTAGSIIEMDAYDSVNNATGGILMTAGTGDINMTITGDGGDFSATTSNGDVLLNAVGAGRDVQVTSNAGDIEFDTATTGRNITFGVSNVSRTVNLSTTTGADTINIATGATNADVVNIGNAGVGTTLNYSTGATTADPFDYAAVSVTTADVFDVDATGLTTGSIMDLTATNTHTADAAVRQMALNFTNAQATAANSDFRGWSLNFTNNPSIAGNTEYAAMIQNQVTANVTDNAVAALLRLDNADTNAGGSTVATNALEISNSGAIAGGITNAINISSTTVTTDFNLQNGLTIDNDTDGDLDIVENALTLTMDFDEVASTIRYESASSLDFESTANAADSILINSTVGGIDIVTNSTEDLDINASGGLNLGSSEAADGAITIATSNAAGQIVVTSTDSTADAIDMNATAGGIDIDITNAAADTDDFNVTLTGAEGDFVVSSGDDMDLDTADDFTLDTADGSVAVTAAGAANGDITLDAADVFTINAADDTAAALDINATAGGIDIDITNAAADTDDFNVTVTGAAGDIILSSGDDYNLTTTGLSLATIGGTYDVDATGAVTIDSDAAMTLGGLSITAAADGGIFDMDATGAVTIDSSASTIGIGTDAVAQAINIGTGAAARTITMGNVTGATGLALNAGTGHITATSTGTGDIILNSDDTMLLDADGVLELNSSAGAISIGNDADAQAINIGSGASARTITMGNAVSTLVDIDAVSIDIDGAATGVTIDALDAGTLNIGTSADGASDTSAINIGTSASARTITMGNAASTLIDLNAISVDIDGAATGVTIDALDAGTINLGTSADGASDTSAINIGTSASARTITVGNDASTTVDVNALAIELDSANTIVANAVATIDIDSGGVITIDTTADELQIATDTADTVFTGSADDTTAITVTAGDVVLADGDLDISGGDVDITLDAADGMSIGAASTTADAVVITSSVPATNDSIDGLTIAHTLTDSNASAGLNVVVTNVNDATAVDTVYGLFVEVDDNSTLADDTAHGIFVRNANSGSDDEDLAIDSFLYIAQDDTDDPVVSGIYFDVAAGGLTTALDASDPQITTALDVNGNSIEATELDFNIAPTGATSSMSITASADAEDFTLELLGNFNTTLALESAGNNANAMEFTTTAGGMDILVIGDAAGEDLDIATAGALTEMRLSSESKENDAILLDSAASSGGITLIVGTDEVEDNADGDDIELKATDDVIVSLTAAGQFVINNATDAPTADIMTLSNAAKATETADTDALNITFSTAEGATGSTLINLNPTFASTTDASNHTVINVANYTATSTTNDLVTDAINIGNLTEAGTGTVTSTAIDIGTGWDTAIAMASGGLQLDDDVPVTFGTDLDGAIQYETADANANALTITLPEDAGNDIPILVVGLANDVNGDLGLFNAVDDPSIALVSDDGGDYLQFEISTVGIVDMVTNNGDIKLTPGGGNVNPGSAGVEILGDTTAEWDGLYVGDTGVGITLGVDQDDVITHDGTNLDLQAAADITLDPTGNNVSPGFAGDDILGDTTAEWNGLYVGDTGVGITLGVDQDDVITHDGTNLDLQAAADITLDPTGNNVSPGGDDEDDLGVIGTEWRTVITEALDINMGDVGDTVTIDSAAAATADTVAILSATGTDSRSALDIGWTATSSNLGAAINVDLNNESHTDNDTSYGIYVNIDDNDDNDDDTLYGVYVNNENGLNAADAFLAFENDDTEADDAVTTGIVFLAGQENLDFTTGLDFSAADITTDIVLSAGETIDGDGTDLTLASGNNIDLTASGTGDVIIPVNIGLIFGDGAEKIESNNTDLTLNSGVDINLTATDDVNLGANVGLVLSADDLEKIEGDGSNITLTAGADILFTPAGDNKAIAPSANDGAALGKVTTNEFSDIFLADGAVILFDNESSITHSASLLTIAGDFATSSLIQHTGTMNADFTGDSYFKVTSEYEDGNLTLEVDGDRASSLILSSDGTGTDAIDMNTTAGGIDVDSSGSVNITSSEAAADALRLYASNAAGGIDIDFGTGNLDIDGTGANTAFTLDSSSFALAAGGVDSNITLSADGAGDDLTISVTGAQDTSLVLSSTGTAANAIDMNTTAGGITIDTAGALSLDSTGTASNLTLTSNSANAGILTIAVTNAGAGTATIDMDATDAVTIDAGGASNFTTSAGDVSVIASAASVVIRGVEAAGDAILLDANNNAAGGIDIDFGTGNLDIDGLGADSDFTLDSSSFSLDALGKYSNITLTSDGAGDDLTISLAGATDSSLVLTSVGTGADAISISSWVGGLTVDAVGALSLDSVSTASNLTLTSNSDNAGILTIAAINDGAGTATLDIDADEAVTINAGAASNFTTSAGDVSVIASAASVVIRGVEAAGDAILLDANNNAAGGIDIDFGTGNLDIDGLGADSDFLVDSSSFSLDALGKDSNITLAADGTGDDLTISVTGAQDTTLALNSSGTAANALEIITTAGGIDITNGGAAGGTEDIDISSTNASVFITAAEGTADAIYLNASGGGIDIDADAGITMDADDVIAVTIAGNEFQIATGAADTVFTGSVDGVAAVTVTQGDVDLLNGDLLVAGGDFDVTLDAADDASLTKAAAAAASEEGFEINFSTGAGDGNDIYRALVLDVASSVTHGDSSNQVIGLDIDALATADAEAIETGIRIGDGWDRGLNLLDDITLMFGDDGNDSVSAAWNNANTALELDGGLVAIGSDPTGATATGDGDLIVQDALEVDGNTDLDGDLNVAGDIATSANIAIALAGAETFAVTNGSSGDATFNLTSTGDFVIQDGGGDILKIAGTGGQITMTETANFTFGADEQIVIDSEAADSTVTDGIINIDMDAAGGAAITQSAINLDIETIADGGADTIIGLDVLMTQTSTDNEIINGIRVQDLAGTPDDGAEVAIYQAGTNWDYGLIVEDVALLDGAISIGSAAAVLAVNATPSVSGSSYFTDAGGLGADITDFTNETAGQIFTIVHNGVTTIDCGRAVSTTLYCGAGAGDITTADGDSSTWFADENGDFYLISWTNQSAGPQGVDLAEWFPATEDLEAGDVLVASGTNPVHVSKSTGGYQKGLIGAVTTQPGLILGAEGEEGTYSAQVALAGRVPVNVTDENGPIEVGDYLTSSATVPGHAMKATEIGPVIGFAMEEHLSGTGQIVVKVDNMWYSPRPEANELQGGDANAIDVVDNVNVVDGSFEGSVTVAEHLYGSRDMAGRVRLNAGDNKVEVEFDEEYAHLPIVTFSLRTDKHVPGRVWVSDESTEGFTINHSAGSTTEYDLEFNWIAIGVEEAMVTISDGTTEDVEVSVESDVVAEAAEVVEEEPVVEEEVVEEEPAAEEVPEVVEDEPAEEPEVEEVVE